MISSRMTAGVQISGATGFVGTSLLDYLKKAGFSDISSFGRNEFNAPEIQLTPGCQAFVHLAGKAHDLRKVSHPEDYYQVNFELTKQLYDAFLRSTAQKFIFISSVKAAADTVNGLLDEGATPDPKSHYGKSKLLAEEYIESQRLPEGKFYYILRPCMIHGPGNKGNLNLLYKFISSGFPFPLAAFENRRSFLSVENLCFVIREILERTDIPTGTYHVADDDSLSTTEVVRVMAETIGKPVRLWHVPKGIIAAIARAGDILRLPLTTERLAKLTENYVVCNDRIRKVLNKPFPLSAKDGIRSTVKALKDQ